MWHLRREMIGKALDAKRRHRQQQYFRLSIQVRNELAAWLQVLQGWTGEWLLDPSDWKGQGCRVLHSDACQEGQGGYSDQGDWFSEAWSLATLQKAQRKERLSLPYLEMQAAVNAIKNLTKPTPGKPLRVLLMCDCLPVVQAINHGYCHEEGMAELLFGLSEWCVRGNVYLRVEHLSSAENRWADLLSRFDVFDFLQESGYSRHSRVSRLGQ